MSDPFEGGQLVWAKFTSYPWWPAFLTGKRENESEKREVIFFGTFDRSFIAEKFLRLFDDQPDFTKKDAKNRALQQAILAAQSVRAGNSTIDCEIEKLAAADPPTRPPVPKPPRKSPPKQPPSQSEDSIIEPESLSHKSEALPSFEASQPRMAKSKSLNIPKRRTSKPPGLPASHAPADQRLKTVVDKIALLDETLPEQLEELARIIAGLSDPVSLRAFIRSEAGKILTKLRATLLTYPPSEALSLAFPAVQAAITAAQKAVLVEFFSRGEPGESHEALAAELAQGILDTQLKCLCSPGSKERPNPQIGVPRPHRASTVESEGVRVERQVQLRVQSKLVRVIIRAVARPVSKNDCEEAARRIQNSLRTKARSLQEYKRIFLGLMNGRRKEIGELVDRLATIPREHWDLAIEEMIEKDAE